MKLGSPHIGIDRFIQLEWAAAALRVRAGMADLSELTNLLDASHSGPAAKKKTRTVLNRLWLDPSPDLADFADRGVKMYRESPDTPISALTWGMALANYPFFASVAEIVGRLIALQGDCTSAEVHRRMSEIYGQREGTRRMTNMVLQTQSSWGGASRVENGNIIKFGKKIEISNNLLIAWIAEAIIRCIGKPSRQSNIFSSSLIYPFDVKNRSSYILSVNDNFTISYDSNMDLVAALS